MRNKIGDDLDILTNKKSINIKLFLLKPEMLPCHDELSDPTELPLSRDLMDVRSNVGQDMSTAGGDRLIQGPIAIIIALLTLTFRRG